MLTERYRSVPNRWFSSGRTRPATARFPAERPLRRHSSGGALTMMITANAPPGAHGSCRTSFPVFSPLNSIRNVCGKSSTVPSTTCSLTLIRPSPIQPAISAAASA